MKAIKMMVFVFLFVVGMVPLTAYEAQIDGGIVLVKDNGQEHTDVADDDEREKKDMIPLTAYEAQIDRGLGSAKDNGQEHTDVADDDEREKKDNGQQELVTSDNQQFLLK